MPNYSTPKVSIVRWLNASLFNTSSANRYFETLVEGIDPMWSLETAKAQVNKVHFETDHVLTINLSPNQRFAGFKAGQHVQLTVEINGARKTRTFSIASSPHQWSTQNILELTIKAIKNGEVTQWIHNHLKPGTVVRLSQAQGKFILPKSPESILYVAGGSGITPIMSQIRELLNHQFPFPITLLYYAKHQNEFIFRQELQTIAKRFGNFKLHLITTREHQSNSKVNGHLSAEHLTQSITHVPKHIFVCGPQGLQQQAFAASQKVFGDTPTLHKEQFGLKVQSTNPDKNKLQPIMLNRSNKTIECDTNTPLLEAAEQNGLSPNYGCRMGICYTCKCKKRSGVVRNAITGALSGTAEEDIQLCISIPETPVELDL